jgi:hypothetical protein
MAKMGETASSSSTGFGSSSGSKQSTNNKWDTKRLLKIFYWLIVAATAWFAYMNIAPYAAIVKMGMVKTADPNLLRLIGMIPIVNGIAAILGASLHLIIGTILWAIIQTLEVLPMLLKRDPSFVKEVVNNTDKHSKYAEKPDDDPVLANLKRYYNQFPILAIKQAKNLMLFAYTIDLLICITIYPPVSSGGIDKLMFVLMTGQFQLLNYSNLILLAVTLLIVEFMLKLLFFIGQIGWYMRKAHQ